MARIANYAGRILVAGSGGSLFYEIGSIQSAELNIEADTQDETVWQDRGFKNEVPDIVGGTLSIEGLYEKGDEGQAILEDKLLIRDQDKFVIIKYFNDYQDTARYYQFRAYVSSFSKQQEVEGKLPFSCELAVKGEIVKVGY